KSLWEDFGIKDPFIPVWFRILSKSFERCVLQSCGLVQSKEKQMGLGGYDIVTFHWIDDICSCNEFLLGIMLSIFVFLLLQGKAISQKIEGNDDQKALCLLALGKKLPNMLGNFVPVCDDNGDFRPKQCSTSQGQCWCVDPKTGQEIEGSRTGPGRFLDCSANSKGSCRDELMQVLNKSVAPDTFVPSCINNGLYSSTQCHESIGQCWCVNVDTGAEISGTRTKAGSETTIDCLQYEKVRCPNGQPLEERDCSMDNPCPTGFTCHLITLSPEKAGCCPACILMRNHCKVTDEILPFLFNQKDWGTIDKSRVGISHMTKDFRGSFIASHRFACRKWVAIGYPTPGTDFLCDCFVPVGPYLLSGVSVLPISTHLCRDPIHDLSAKKT
uniref:Thyroglobulin type-1 domain-containing protein n=1 Tax=Romanomermis culicivorax TaxID=13658 RepID=A0A915I3J8_ROMCU